MIKNIESGISGKALGSNSLFWVKGLANQFQIKGAVFTKQDGSIRVVAEGEEENLIKFTEKLEKGNLFSSVENFYVKWKEPRENSGDFYVLNN